MNYKKFKRDISHSINDIKVQIELMSNITERAHELSKSFDDFVMKFKSIEPKDLK